jgi:hypothetical protein
VLENLAEANPERLKIFPKFQVKRRELEKTLTTGKYDVFVFLGAGTVKSKGAIPKISKRGGLRQGLQSIAETGDDDGLIDRNDLGGDLKRAGVRLAVLNGSHSDWVARSLAKHVPASIGFRETTRRETRRVVVKELFRALLDGLPLDMAVTAVRQAIDRDEPGTGEWCRLIFFLQPPNGNLLLSPPQQAEPRQYEAQPVQNREVAKLLRLLEVYQNNLAVLQRGSRARATATQPDAHHQRQVDELIEKVSALESQIKAAREADSSS